MAEELNDLKALWQKSKVGKPSPEITLDQVTHYKPKTTLYWIKIILSIEFGLSIIGFPFVSYYLWKVEPNTGLLIFYSLITIAYLFYYRFLIRSINQFNYSTNVVAGLKKVYRYLNFYLLHYKVVIWLSLIIGFVSGLLTGVDQALADNEIPDEKVLSFWLITLAVSVFFLAIVGGIMHFLVHLIYGRKIKRLKKLVKSFESEE